MIQVRIAGALLLCALHAPGMARAQDAPVALAAAVDAAWARAVESAQSAGHARRAEAALRAAEAPWAAAPSLELGQRVDRNTLGNGRETNLGVTVPLWLPGQRSARRDAASAELEAARAVRDAAKLRVAAQVREAQGSYLQLQAELEASEAALRSLAELARDVDRRVAAGDLARTDSLAATAEQLAAQGALLSARHQVQAALSQWRSLTGLAQMAAAERADSAPAAGLLPEHPSLREATHAVQAAQKRMEAVQATRRDPPEVTIGARHEVPAGGGPSSRGIGVSLRVPFATDDRNQPLLAAALSDLELARAREARLRAELASQLEIAQAGLETARRSVADEESRARLLRERYTLLERSWRAGNTALPDLLRALGAAAQANGELRRKQAARDLAAARVQQALGILP